MNAQRAPGPDPHTWHASPALLAAYAGGRAQPADVWAVESHLVGCPLCRAELTAVLMPADQEILDDAGDRLVAALPERRGVRLRRSLRRFAWTLQPATAVAVAVAVGAVTVFDLLAGVGGGDGGVLWLLAPAIPVAGVAVAAVGDDDPCREAVFAAPSAVLRLVLWRTLAVLLLAVPLTSAAGFLRAAAGGEAGWNAAWLLPCLALTSTTLAAGAFVGVERAARAVALLWCAAALGPSLVHTGGDVLAAIRLAAAPLAQTPAFTGAAQLVWASVTLAALVAVAATHERFTFENVRMGVTDDVA